MNVAFINPFLLATKDVFDKMVHVSFVQGKPALRRPDDRIFKLYSVSASIGLSGAVSGVAVLSLAEPVAIALASGLSGQAVEQLTPESMDALAELMNMVAGSAKSRMPCGQVQLTVPTMLYTKDVVYPPGAPVILIPFDTEHGRFVIEVGLYAPSHNKPSAQREGRD